MFYKVVLHVVISIDSTFKQSWGGDIESTMEHFDKFVFVGWESSNKVAIKM